MKNSFNDFNSRLDNTGERKLQDKSFEIIEVGGKRKKNEESEESLMDLQHTTKSNSVCIIGVTEEQEKGTKRLSEEIMAKNLPNLRKEMDIEIQEN